MTKTMLPEETQKINTISSLDLKENCLSHMSNNDSNTEQQVKLANITIITSEYPERLTKLFQLKEGKLSIEGGGNMSKGHAVNHEIKNLEELRQVIIKLNTDQAITYGRPETLPIKLLTKKEWRKQGEPIHSIPRTKDMFKWSLGAGVMMLDYDPRSDEQALSSDELVQTLRNNVPWLENIEMLTIPSSSSHVFNKETEEDLTGLRGQRIYLLVDNASLIPDLGKKIVEHLWATGNGYIFISGAGSQLERTIVDSAVWQPERLDFAAGGYCVSPLEQRRGEGCIYPGEYEILKTIQVPEIPPNIKNLSATFRSKEKKYREPEALKVKEAWIEKGIDKLVGKSAGKEKREKARETLYKAVDGCVLTGDYQIILKENGNEETVTVSQILSSPEKYNHLETLDPLEPDYDNRGQKGKIFLNKGEPYIYSLAHGGCKFKLLDTTSSSSKSSHLPQLELPGKGTKIIQSAEVSGKILSKTGEHFTREGGDLYRLEGRKGKQVLKLVTPASFLSEIEKYAEVGSTTTGGQFQQKPCSEAAAKAILASSNFSKEMPKVSIICNSPVLTRREGKPYKIHGHDKELEILVLNTNKSKPSKQNIQESVDNITNLLKDFLFATPSDLSRAVGAILTPAIVQGGLISGRPPITIVDADKSQAGKGLWVKLTRIIYNEKGAYISKRKGGVGSIDEDYCGALAEGSPFIIFDNIRGRFESQLIESALTEDSVYGRGAYGKNQELDPTKTTHFLTSNNAELNKDMANRGNFISIKKRPDGYEFQAFDEGDVIDHCEKNHHIYLEAIHTILEDWIIKGCPKTNETGHDRRHWSRAIDWIIQEYFKLPSIMVNHKNRKLRATDEKLTWLRKLAIIMTETNEDRWVSTNDILDVIECDQDISIPGCKDRDLLRDDSKRRAALQGMGRNFSMLIKNHGEEREAGQESIELDGYSVTRRFVHKEYDSSNGAKKSAEYLFLPIGLD